MAIRALICGAALVAASSTLAHDAPSGWRYDAECCSSRDCAQALPGAVREVLGGYAITLLPGTHPMVPRGSEPVREFVPHGDWRIRPSGDEHRHVCVLPHAQRVLCIYIPSGGV